MSLLRKLGDILLATLLFLFLVGTHSFFIMAEDHHQSTGYTGSGNRATFAADNDNDNEAASSSSEAQQPKEDNSVPLLPEPDANSNLPSIKLGETISFEAMGPIILNADGSTRRIDNWDELTEQEKKTTWRRISQRNEKRRKQLLLEQQQQQEAEAAKGSVGKEEL